MATKKTFGKMLNEKPVTKKVMTDARPKNLDDLRKIAKKKLAGK